MSERPNVVFISLDTLRADRLGCYTGGTSTLTPWLDSVAAAGIKFDNAFAQIPFTLPSHLSMFTGVYPDVHGVEKKDSHLSRGLPTLTETLASAGYTSLGLVSNNWMKGEFGFNRGFNRYSKVPYGLTYAETINQRLFELLDGDFRDAGPLFIFLHYVDPHSDFTKVTGNTLPYYSPDEFRAHLDTDPTSREFCIRDRCASEYLLDLNKAGLSAPPPTLKKISALYDAGVRYTDMALERLFNGLGKRGVLDNAVVVITSDHGEEFWEHGQFLHDQPYVENLHVPMLLQLPGFERSGASVHMIVESIDLMPTILDYLELPIPDHVQGRSLLPVIAEPETTHMTGFALGRAKLNPNLYSLRSTDYTLISDVSSGRTELYDRRVDPRELVDVSSDHPDMVNNLAAELSVLLARNRPLTEEFPPLGGAEDVLTSEQQEQLKRLGYLQ